GESVPTRTAAPQGLPLGRMTETCAGSTPAASQPSSTADPIFPQPTSHKGPERKRSAMTRLSLALGLDQRRGDGLLGRLVGPEHELEDRVEALALLDRRLDQGLGLLQAQRTALVPGFEQGGVAEEDEARGRPELEMAEPEL